MSLPNDFRSLAKAPMPGNLQISGTQLQENFEYLDKSELIELQYVKNNAPATSNFLIEKNESRNY